MKKGENGSIHIIADFKGCASNLLEKGKAGEEILQKTVDESGLHCVLIRYHQFEPIGYTAAALLTESHITLHTWPEYSAVQIDIFTCGEHDKARRAYGILEEVFNPQHISKETFLRNLDEIVRVE